MSDRLTEKLENEHYKVSPKFYEISFIASDKLGQLEDIEEELGIDLITLFKALTNGVYYLNKQKELHWCQARNLVISQKSLRVYRHHYKLFKDYGKTWALTKEELL